MTRFLGPIISTNKLSLWEQLLTGGFAMQASEVSSLGSADVERFWGLSGYRANTQTYTSLSQVDEIRVVAFDPEPAATIRDPLSGYDSNALKVIDFFTSDFDAAVSRLGRAGFRLKDDVAKYDLPEAAGIVEGHLWGPDDVVCALIAGPAEFLGQFVRDTRSLYSEVMSVSAPVAEPTAVIAFYELLGLQDVYRYEIDDVSFQQLVGADLRLHIRAVNMGNDRRDPYLGIIHYGLPDRAFKRLNSRAVMPNRGLVAATVMVERLDQLAEACQQQGLEILAPPVDAHIAPHGPCRSFCVKAPHGVIHHCIEPIAC